MANHIDNANDQHQRRRAQLRRAKRHALKLLKTPLIKDAFEALRLMEARGVDIANLTGVRPLPPPNNARSPKGRLS